MVGNGEYNAKVCMHVCVCMMQPQQCLTYSIISHLLLQDPEKPYWVGHLHFFGRTHLQQMLESLDYKIVATSCHDHPHSAGFVNPGQEPYDVEAVPIEMDSEASTSESPKALRLLARKVL